MLRLSISGTKPSADEAAINNIDLRGAAFEALSDRVELASDPEKPYLGVFFCIELLWAFAADSRAVGCAYSLVLLGAGADIRCLKLVFLAAEAVG